jgi:hypothetical protein
MYRGKANNVWQAEDGMQAGCAALTFPAAAPKAYLE